MRVPVKLIGFVYWLFFLNCCQCQAKQKCPDLSMENGFTYSNPSNKDEIYYSCNTGYKPFSGNWWDSATCIEGSWSEEPRCIREEECGAFPSVHHGKLKQTKKTFRDGDSTAFECDPGFISTTYSIKCVNGVWEKPVCEVGVHCGIPPKVEKAFITSKPEEFYVDGSSVTYTCQSKFSMNGDETVFCRNKIWGKTPTCEEVTCPLNTTMGALKIKRFPDNGGSIKPGDKLTFSCNGRGLILKGQKEIFCHSNGEWSSPFPKCEEIMCVKKLPGNMRSDLTEDGHPGTEVSIRPGHTITLSCVRKGTKLQGASSVTCLPSGKWNIQFPKCVGDKCERPPQVEFANTTEMTKPEYNPKEKVEYTCFNKYSLDPLYSQYLTCEQGEWRGNIKCLKKCERPPQVEFADTTEMTKSEYNSREKVEYTCFNKYTLDPRYSKHLICEQGEWRGNIKCLKPCTVTVEEMDNRGIQLRWAGREKIFSAHDDKITFACQWGKRLIGSNSNLIQYCNDGKMDLPECE